MHLALYGFDSERNMTTRRTTFTRTPFVISAFLAANLVATGAPAIAFADEGAPQDNSTAAAEQQAPEPQSDEQPQEEGQSQDEGQSQEDGQFEEQIAKPYEVKDETTILIKGDLTSVFWEDEKPLWDDDVNKEKITSVVVSKEVKATAPMTNLFNGFTALESVDLGELEVTAEATASKDMFKDCSKLSTIILSKTFVVKGADPAFPTPKGDNYSGKWSNGTKALSAEELAKLYGEAQTEAYTWKWQEYVEPVLSVEAPTDAYTYNGKEHTPTPKTSVSVAGKTLTEGAEKDYTLAITYENNVNAGTATITVEATAGKGYDAGGYQVWDTATKPSASTTFTINKRSVNLTVKDATMVYDGYKVEDAQTDPKTLFKVTRGTNDIIEGDKSKVKITAKYVCEWERKVGKYKITVTDVKIKNTDSTSTAAEDVPASNYEVGTIKDGTFTITAEDISKATVQTVADRTHTGKAIEPTPAVTMSYTYNGATKTATLTKDKDYTLGYENNTNVGTATINVTGKNNFTGTKKVTFKIKAAASTTTKTTTSSTTASRSTTPSTADVTPGVTALLASGSAALAASRLAKKRED